MEQVEKKEDSGQRQQQRPNNRQRRRDRQAVRQNQLKTLDKWKEENHVAGLKPKEIADRWAANDVGIVKLMAEVKRIGKQQLYPLAIAKMFDATSVDVYQKHYDMLPRSQKQELFSLIVADDFSDVAKSAIKHVSGPLLSYLWGEMKGTELYKRAQRAIKDYTGLDLNDDSPDLKRTIDASH